MATAIIIAGMHRSGTSATTGALRLSGISLGKGLLEGAADNPKGYFENERAVQIHEKLLAELGRSWDDVRELPAGWMDTAAASEAKSAIHRLIETEFAGEELWAVKDPRICRFIPLWREVLDRLGIRVASLHVVRRPGEVAASISARNGWDRKLGELLWMRHVFEAESYTRDVPRSVISYETLLKDPATSIVRALGQLGVEIDVQAHAASNLSGFVETKDRHHVESPTGGGDGAFTNLMNAAYAGLVAIEQGNGGWQAVQELSKRSYDWLQAPEPYIDAVALKAARHASDFASMEVRNYELQSALNAQIAWSEEAVTREQRLRAELETMTTLPTQGGAGLLAALQEQAESLSKVVKDLAQERICVAEERKQWAAERILLDGERAVLERQRDQANELVSVLRQDLHDLTERNAQLNEEMRTLALRAEAVYRSLSWRLTRPLRVIADRIRSMLRRSPV